MSSPPDPAESARAAALVPAEWRTNLLLFTATVISVFATGVYGDRAGASAAEAAAAQHGALAALVAPFLTHDAVLHGAQFTGALLTILVAHELGHYVAARIHKVDASLPFFIPMPFLSPFGTMGAVIRMRGTIPTRAALLDIGASGPLAGLAFAIPLYMWGAAHSHVVVAGGPDMVQLGESLALKALHRIAAPEIPPGLDLELSPVAFAAWAGLLVTMINLVPVAQLDGGHVAYALFGPRQDRFAQIVHRSMLVFFFVSVGAYTLRDVNGGLGFRHIGAHVGNSLFWLVWFEMLAIIGALSSRAARPSDAEGGRGILTIRARIVAILGLLVLAGIGRDRPSVMFWLAWFAGLGLLIVMEVKGGALRPNNTLLDHPPTGAAPLGAGRAAVAIFTLVMFALLFMPTPMVM